MWTKHQDFVKVCPGQPGINIDVIKV